MSNDTADAQSFNKNYQTLKGIAETLRDQKEPDIDALVPMVEEATQAYKVCSARLQAVELALKEHFSQETAESKVEKAEQA